MLLVTLCWVACEVLTEGSSNTPSHFLLGILCWSNIPSRGSSDAPSCSMLWKPELSTSLMSFVTRFNPVYWTQDFTLPDK